MSPAFVVLATLAACGRDPVLERAEERMASQEATEAPATRPLPPSGRPGVPAEPAPGVPAEPAPGDPLGSGAGGGVEVSGTVEFPAWKAGTVKVVAFDREHAAGGGAPAKVLGFTSLARPGPFTLKVPAGSGIVYVEASVDADGDGRPGPVDPSGDAAPVAAPASGVTIVVITREPPKD